MSSAITFECDSSLDTSLDTSILASSRHAAFLVRDQKKLKSTPQKISPLAQVFHRTFIERPAIQTRSVHFPAAADILLTVDYDLIIFCFFVS
jgi:hypothetical protein